VLRWSRPTGIRGLRDPVRWCETRPSQLGALNHQYRIVAKFLLTGCMSLVLIGYWKSDRHPDWPDPHAFVDPSWDENERHLTSAYLSSGTILRAGAGYSPCRFCGMNNGSVEFTDGTYVWPEGLAHYIHDHDVRLPRAVVEHAVRCLDSLEAEPIDLAWWKAQNAL
jgi:hypothetical protein